MTLNFAKNGLPRKDKTFKVYLRYQYKNSEKGDTAYEYLPSEYFLNANDFELLLKDRLPGKVNVDLQNFKRDVVNIVNDIKLRTEAWPKGATILKALQKEEKIVTQYFGEYLVDLKSRVKDSSYQVNVNMIDTISVAVAKLGELKKKDYWTKPKVFASEETTKELLQYFIDQKTANGYTKPLMRLMVRLQNWIRTKYGLPIIKGQFQFLNSTYKKYKLSEKEVDILITHPTVVAKQKEVQKVIKVNMLLALRIDEVVNLRASDIHLHHDHAIIYIVETKKNRSREVAIVDADAIDHLRDLVNECVTDRLFSINKDDFNYHFKQLAKDTGAFNDKLPMVKNVGANIIQDRVPKWEVLSSHSIRKYAVTAIGKKFGIQTAKYFSGHTSLTTIQKHYLDDMQTQEVVESLKKNTTKTIKSPKGLLQYGCEECQGTWYVPAGGKRVTNCCYCNSDVVSAR